MADNATIEIELEGQTAWWNEFTSNKVELCGFEWFVSGAYNLRHGFKIDRTVIHCAPVSGRETSTWSCEAKVKFVAFAQDKEGDEVTYSKNLSHRFNFREHDSAPISFNFGEQFANEMNFVDGNDCKIELRLNVIEYNQVDYGRPYNAMLKCPDDSAQVVVDGTTLFLSKEVLGAASPFFKALFTNDSEEKRNGKFGLKDIKLAEFMHFIRIIYGVDVELISTVETSLRYLLRLQELYPCEVVRSKCYEILIAATLTETEKLQIGDRFHFQDVVDTVIENMEIKDLTAVGKEMQLQTYSHKTSFDILKTALERHSLVDTSLEEIEGKALKRLVEEADLTQFSHGTVCLMVEKLNKMCDCTGVFRDDKATIEIELEAQRGRFTSSKVELCGFEWFVSGTYDHQNGFKIHFTVIHCAPVCGRETSTWSCEANGEFVAFARDDKGCKATYSKLWSHCFNFRESESAPVSFNFGGQIANEMNFLHGNDCKLELQLNVTKYNQVDYGRPYNAMLKCPDDSAQVVVDGTTLFLSKEILGGACPFFHAYFNNDFKEKRDGEFPLTDVKLDEFWRFVAIIYGVEIDIDQTSLQYLLRLEDKYQCEAVRTKCHAFLVATDTLTNQEKLRIGDRFRFQDVIDAAIEKMNIQELTAVGQQMEIETYSHKTTLSILKAVSVRHSC